MTDGASAPQNDDAGVVAEPTPARWVTTWSTSLVSDSLADLLRPFHGVTLRQIVRTSVAGERVRVRFSNHFGRGPLHIEAAHIAQRSTGSSIVRASDRTLSFDGATRVTIPRGQTVTSDPVTLPVPALSELAISMYLSKRTQVQNAHREAAQTNYVSAAGNFVGAETLPTGSALTSWFFLAGVEVETRDSAHTVVTLGDSITDGFSSSVDRAERWPDELARRLVAAGKPIGVANQGYSGNCLLAGGAGEAALLRFDRDVFDNAGVSHVIVAVGINDIGIGGAVAEQVIDGLQQLIDKAHRAGLVIIGATLCPFEGAFYYTEEREAARVAVNAWIRGSGAFDGIVDFEQALSDPIMPARMLRAYDSGDHLHPSDLGYEVLGQAVDLSLLERRPR